NVRTEGIDESDLVKTDGDYIYALSINNKNVSIYEANPDNPKKLATLEIPEGDYVIREMFVDKDRLVVLGGTRDMYSCMCYGVADDIVRDKNDSKEETTALIYDISDLSNIKKVDEIKQSGSFLEGRLKDGILYTFSNYRIRQYFYMLDENNFNYSSDELKGYIPEINNELCPENDLRIQDGSKAENYSVMTAYSLDNDEMIDKKSVLGGGSTVYMSSDSIYLFEEDYSKLKAKVNISKLSYEDGYFEILSSTKIDGMLYYAEDEAFDEYDGYLRMLVTDTDSKYEGYTRLLVLDDNLKTVGMIDDIAKGEEIKSARYFGNTCFFVTYENTDPLFSVDLSNPAEPKIIGKLKIPGFSTYLHPFGEGLLLGIGQTDDGTVKLSMFDISDPKDVKELDTKTLEGCYYSSVFSNPRALYYDEANKSFGLAVQMEKRLASDDDDLIVIDSYNQTAEFKFFGYDKDFYEKNSVEIVSMEDSYMDDIYQYISNVLEYSRAIYIDDYIYVVNAGMGVKVLDRE
nr:beta-propeller domain-containing protein [Lachnospiraceae bacterium]